MKLKIVSFSLLFSSVLLSGCGTALNIGSADFACPGTVETGFKCMGVRDLYKATEGPSDSFGKKAEELKNGKDKNGNELISKEEAEGKDVRRAGAFEPTPWMDKPRPIRSQAKVMRVWVAPYEDESGDLNAPGIVYTEIEGRRWNIGEGLVKKPSVTQSLNGSLGGDGSSTPFAVRNLSGRDVGTLKNITPIDKGAKDNTKANQAPQARSNYPKQNSSKENSPVYTNQ